MRAPTAISLVCVLISPALAQVDDAARGQLAYRTCVACRSLTPDRNTTGPSLAGLSGR